MNTTPNGRAPARSTTSIVPARILCRLRAAGLLGGDEVRERDRVAKLHGPAGERHRHVGRSQSVRGPHRGSLPPVRRPPRSRVRRRAAADGQALLHEWCRHDFQGAGIRLMSRYPRPPPPPPVSRGALSMPRAFQPEKPAGQTAVFAAGCFWCVEEAFDKLTGVIATTSGYTAGRTPNPTYEQVSSGTTGHTEALQVTYDPSKVSYDTLLQHSGATSMPSTAAGSSATAAVSIDRASTISRTNRSGRPRPRRRGSRRNLASPSRRRSSLPEHFTQPRGTTRITTRRTRCGTSSTSGIAGERNGWRSCGAATRVASTRRDAHP